MQIDLSESQLAPFNRQGVFLLISNAGRDDVAANQQFTLAGELKSVGFVGDGQARGLKAHFLWLAELTPDGWVEVTDPKKSDPFYSLHLFAAPTFPQRGEMVLLPRPPISFDSWRFLDPRHKVELPLRREDIIVPVT